MHDNHQIVSEIKALFQSSASPPREHLAKLSERYFGACQEVNDRLGSCAGLLRKGLRTEAVYEAEMEPNLLAATAALDFPERTTFDSWLAANKMRVPSALLLEAAAELNQAYAVERQVDEVVRRHRRLALRRAPLAERCAQLRTLAQNDPNNVIWHEDLVSLERACHEELQQQAKAAFARCDFSGLSVVLQWLRDTPWTCAPDRALVDCVGDQFEQLRRANVRGELERVTQTLHQAHLTGDVALGRQVREHWSQLAQIGQLSSRDPLNEMAAPAMEWLAYEDERHAQNQAYQHSMNALSQGLDKHAPRQELERCYHAVAAYDDPVPEMLDRRYQKRMRELIGSRRRRLAFVAAIAFSCIAIAGTLTFLWYRNKMIQKQVDAEVLSLKDMLKAKNIEEANNRLTELEKTSPWILARPELNPVVAEVKNARQVEIDRAQQFRKALARYQSSIQQLQEALNDASDEPPEKVLNILEKADVNHGAYRDAESIATVEERTSLSNVKADAEIERTKARGAMAVAYKAVVDSYEKQRDEFQRIVTEPEPIQLALQRLRGFVAAHQSVSKGSKDHADLVVKGLDAQHTKAQGRVRYLDKLRNMHNEVGDFAGFQRALMDLSELLPDGEEGKEAAEHFRRVRTEEVDVWKRIDDWNALLADYKSKDLTKLRPEEAGAESKALKSRLQAFREMPGAASFNEVIGLLDAASRRNEDGADLAKDLAGTIATPIMGQNIRVIEHTDGRRFYLGVEPKNMQNVQYVVTYYVTASKTLTDQFKPNEIVNVKGVPSPEAAVVAAVSGILRDWSKKGWEEAFLESLLLVCDEKRDLHPVVRLQLMRRLVTTGIAGSQTLSQPLRPLDEKLKTELFVHLLLGPAPHFPELDALNWMHPEFKQTDDAAGLADKCWKAVAKTTAALPDLRKSALAARDRAAKGDNLRAAAKSYHWVGILRRPSLREWVCVLKSPLKGAQDLYVMVPADPNPEHRFLFVSSTTDDGGKSREWPINVDDIGPKELLQGRAVFVATSPEP